MKYFLLSIAVVLYAYAQDHAPAAKDYASEAQRERVQNEKKGERIRAELPQAAGMGITILI